MAVARHGRGMTVARQGRGMACVNQTRPHGVNQKEKTQSKPLGARHGMCELVRCRLPRGPAKVETRPIPVGSLYQASIT